MAKCNFNTSSAPEKLSGCCLKISADNEPYKEFMAFLFIPKMGRDLIGTQGKDNRTDFSAANRFRMAGGFGLARHEIKAATDEKWVTNKAYNGLAAGGLGCPGWGLLRSSS
jgi:hypothetical protein